MKVMLIIPDPDLKTTVKEILANSGIQIAAEADSIADFRGKLSKQKFDLIILDSDVEAGLHRKVARIWERDGTLPILLLAREEEPEIKDYPYIFKNVLRQALPLVIHNVVISNKKHLALIKEVERLNTQLASRKVLSIAKALIMQQQGLTEEEAHRMLQKMSMEKGVPLKEVAESIIGQLDSSDSPNFRLGELEGVGMGAAFSRQNKGE